MITQSAHRHRRCQLWALHAPAATQIAILQVCDSLGVELTVVPLTEQYWDRVISHCVSEIRAGRTPNPDVLCNSRVKFGAFHEYLESSFGQRFDRIASGHYARVQRDDVAEHAAPRGSMRLNTADAERSALPHRATTAARSAHAHAEHDAAHEADERQARVSLHSAPDAVKDQTYFLAHMSRRQLARSMFPLGHFSKAQTRQLAAQLSLANQQRKDSQGLCFLGKVKFSEFIKVRGDFAALWFILFCCMLLYCSGGMEAHRELRYLFWFALSFARYTSN